MLESHEDGPAKGLQPIDPTYNDLNQPLPVPPQWRADAHVHLQREPTLRPGRFQRVRAAGRQREPGHQPRLRRFVGGDQRVGPEWGYGDDDV